MSDLHVSLQYALKINHIERSKGAPMKITLFSLLLSFIFISPLANAKDYSHQFKLSNPICINGRITYEDNYTVQCKILTRQTKELARANYDVNYNVTNRIFRLNGQFSQEQLDLLKTTTAATFEMFGYPAHSPQLTYASSEKWTPFNGGYYRTSMEKHSTMYGDFKLEIKAR